MAAALIVGVASLFGCGSSPVHTVAIPATPSTPSIPISTVTNPAVVAKTLYVSTGGTSIGIDEYAANANGNVNPTTFVEAISAGYPASPEAVTTDSSGNLYELVLQGGFPLGLPSASYGLMCEYSSSGTPQGTCANLGDSVFGGGIAVDNKSGSIFVLENNGLIVKFGPAPTTITTLNTLYNASGGANGGGIGIALDGSGDIYVAAATGPTKTSTVFMFPAGSSGAATPTQVIPSAYSPRGIALDPSGNLYISQLAGSTPGAPATGIYEFAAGSTTNSTPLRSISGTATTIYATTDDYLTPIAVDAAGNVFLSNVASGSPSSILVFSSTANGNVGPASTISSTWFNYASYLWLQ
jgi:hypothetical protein